jgi:hypothetical protein
MACLPAIRGARNLTGHVFRSGDGERGSWDRGKVRCRRYVAVGERIDKGRQIQEKPTFKLKHQALVVRPGGGACGKPSA